MNNNEMFDIYKATKKYRLELNMLNSLIGSPNIEDDFKRLITDYPFVTQALPILASTNQQIIATNSTMSTDDWVDYMKVTNMFDLFQKYIDKSLFDYLLGENTIRM